MRARLELVRARVARWRRHRLRRPARARTSSAFRALMRRPDGQREVRPSAPPPAARKWGWWPASGGIEPPPEESERGAQPRRRVTELVSRARAAESPRRRRA